VAERNRPVTGLMISALVIYLDGNDAGTGFYKLAQDLGELPPGTLSAHVKEQFWVSQLKKYMPTTKSTAVNQPAILAPQPRVLARSAACVVARLGSHAAGSK